MLNSIDVNFIFDSASLSARLEDKVLFSSANILQIADVIRQVWWPSILTKNLARFVLQLKKNCQQNINNKRNKYFYNQNNNNSNNNKTIPRKWK